MPIPLSNGLSEGPDNIADMYNQGFELGLTGHILRDNDFKWDLTIQASTFKNEITKLSDEEGEGDLVTGTKRWTVGRSRYDFFSYDYAGVDPANGDALYYVYEENEETGKFEKQINEETGEPETTNDYQDAGKGYWDVTPMPDVLGSVRNSFSYKGFALDFLFIYSIGGKVLDYGYSAMMHPGSYGASLHPDQLNGWRAPGDVTDIPRMEAGAPNLSVGGSSRYLTDASYLAFKNFNFSYTFNSPVIKDFGVDNLKVFVVGENLFLMTARKGLDPQYNLAGTPAGNDYNPSRVVSVGVNVSF